MTDIFIQSQAANAAQGILLKRPSIRAIENVNGCRLDLFRLHDLHADRPSRVISLLDGIEEIFDVVIGILTSEADSRLRVHVFDAIVRLKVPLDIDIAAILFTTQLSHQTCRVTKQPTALFRV